MYCNWEDLVIYHNLLTFWLKLYDYLLKNVSKRTYIYLPNPSVWAGCDSRSFSKKSLYEHSYALKDGDNLNAFFTHLAQSDGAEEYTNSFSAEG